MISWEFSLVDKIVPSVCAICGRSGACGVVCWRCLSALEFLDVETTGCRWIRHNKVFILWDYDRLKRLIWRLKFHRDFLIRDIVAWKLKEYIERHKDVFSNIDVVSFVPMHWIKFRFIRLFNASWFIAREVSKVLGIEMLDLFDVSFRKVSLHRIKDAGERKRRIKGMFKVKRHLGDVKKILLVDDVLTSGATLSYLCSLLKKRNMEVLCLVLCG